MTHCPYCSAEREDTWQYCRKCGSTREEEPRSEHRTFCIHCGAAMEDRWHFCVACGGPADDGGADDEPDEVFGPAVPDGFDAEAARAAMVKTDTTASAPARYVMSKPSPSTSGDTGMKLRPGQPILRPDGATEAAVRDALPGYRSAASIGTWAQLLWLVLGVAAVTIVVGLIVLNTRLEDFRGGGEFTAASQVRNLINTWLSGAVGIAAVGAVGATIAWLYLIYSNQSAIDRVQLKPARWWAIAGWFVPIVNLVLPPVLVHRTWTRARRPDQRRVNPWVVAWWLSLLIFVGGVILVASRPTDSVEKSLDANAMAAITYGFLIVSCLTAVGVISSIGKRQARAARARRAG